MFLREWSDNLLTGMETVDNQHRQLFEIINQFYAQADENTGTDKIVAFLGELEEYAGLHFAEEENYMQAKRYPLLEYHLELHKGLVQQLHQVEKRLLAGELENPTKAVGDFAAAWLNRHIATDDLAFADFCHNTETIRPEDFLGHLCEITSMGNTLLGLGQVKQIDDRYIVIENRSGNPIPARVGTVVKATLPGAHQELHVFIARVVTSNEEKLVLFNSKVIAPLNKRDYPRIPCDLDVSLLPESGTVNARILDISIGGLLLESPCALMLGQAFYAQFVLLNHRIGGCCEVVRVGRTKDSKLLQYGCTFEAESLEMQNLVSEYVFYSQGQQRARIH